MGDRHRPCLARRDPLMRACMDQGIVDDDVLALRKGRKDSDVGRVAAAEIDDPFGSEICGCLVLKRFVLGMIAPQQPRPPCPDRNAAPDRFGNRVLKGAPIEQAPDSRST